MAHTEEGQKAHTDDLSQQRKKKKIFVVAKPFPYVECRIEVVEEMEVCFFSFNALDLSRQIILSPIENAIELIVTQTAKVKGELDMTPVRINPLQQTIQGSVVPSSYLCPNSSAYQL